MKPEALAQLILRIGLALAFLYPPIVAIGDPVSWISYFPAIIRHLPDPLPLVALHTFGAFEAVIALWVLSGWKIRIPAILAALILLAIVVLNSADFPILFRDLSIATIAISLAVYPKVKTA